jgi:squalene synthase HpnC
LYQPARAGSTAFINAGAIAVAATFAHDLARYGPDARYPAPSRAAARAYCQAFARRQYENFSVATLFLPRPLLPHFYAVYAYCRWADDLGDETGGGARALELLRGWRGELLGMYEGVPRHPVMVALRETVARFGIPPQPFLDLLFAFEQDQLVKRFSTYDQLREYCRHSADPVGHLVLYLFESFDAERAALADSICTALQLTNFWQDVARDFAIGRVYLPEEDMRRFGYAESDLHARRFTPAFAALLRFEVERTRDLFRRGEPLIDRVARPLRIDLELFVRGGQAVLGKIERQGYNVWARRPRLAKWEKAALMVGAVWRRLYRQGS